MITEVSHGPSSAYGADKEDFIDEDVDFLGSRSVLRVGIRNNMKEQSKQGVRLQYNAD